MNKLVREFQAQFSPLIFDERVFERIDNAAKLHEETKCHPLSSCAACLNVIGSVATDPAELIKFLGFFGLNIEELYEFKPPLTFEGITYQDTSFVIFEWIGPKESPINEAGGGRGYSRTSVDAFLLGKIDGKITQILIEWKFTEGFHRDIALGKFSGGQGVERLRRYSVVLARLRKKRDLVFEFENDDLPKSGPPIGLYDLSPDHLYQLLRMTLLGKMTTGKRLGERIIEDYHIVHLTHSQNDGINVLHPEYLKLSPGLQRFSGRGLHEVWRELLSSGERERFTHGHWDQAINLLGNSDLREYLFDRYV